MLVRRLTPEDLDIASKFLQLMVAEMVEFGAPPTQDRDQTVNWFRDRIKANIENPNHIFLIAESDSRSPKPFGILEASLTTQDPIYLPRTSLYIHAVYVDLNHRQRGVARRLFEAAFEWGRGNHCIEAELNVLIESPAKTLYEKIGFQVVQAEMRRTL
jgi:GNAT superfamily N-acetyltransferase